MQRRRRVTSELSYSHVGDYLLPDLLPPEETAQSLGKYGLLRKTYLKTHRKILYTNLLTTGALHSHLAGIEAQAGDQLALMMNQMATEQGVTEQVKSVNQLQWVGAMNNIKACAEEIVLQEIVYA